MRPYTRDDVERELIAALEEGDTDGALALAADLDRMPAKLPPTLRGAALWYAEQGLSVFPVMPGDKRPFPHSRGVKDATTDAGQVEEWWTAHPEANIGLATGHRVDVLDYDGTTGHADWGQTFQEPGLTDGLLYCLCGDSWVAAWLGPTCRSCGSPGEPFPELPDPGLRILGTVATPRPGGLHVYVPVTGLGNRAGWVGKHVDYRGLGGYVVAPPSRTEVGVYRWLRPLAVEEAAR